METKKISADGKYSVCYDADTIPKKSLVFLSLAVLKHNKSSP